MHITLARYLTITVSALVLGLMIGAGAGLYVERDYLAPERADQKAADKKAADKKAAESQVDGSPLQMDSSGASGPVPNTTPLPPVNMDIHNFPTIAVDAENAVYATTRNKDLGQKVAVMLQGINNTTLPVLARLDKDGNYRLECVLPDTNK